MPAFRGTVTEAKQFVIEVWISPELLNNALVPENIEKYRFRGLLDIGAAKSSISREVIEKTGLKALGKELLYTASGKSEVDVYSAFISIPIQEDNQKIHVKAFNLQVAAITTGKEFEMIIGMDILEHCLLVVDGRNFILSY